jgi:hypothetical protein
MEENPRIFNVYVGGKQVGRVTSHVDPEDTEGEQYCSERRADDGSYEHIEWHSSLKQAGLAAIEWKYDVPKIDKVIRRKA